MDAAQKAVYSPKLTPYGIDAGASQDVNKGSASRRRSVSVVRSSSLRMWRYADMANAGVRSEFDLTENGPLKGTPRPPRR